MPKERAGGGDIAPECEAGALVRKKVPGELVPGELIGGKTAGPVLPGRPTVDTAPAGTVLDLAALIAAASTPGRPAVVAAAVELPKKPRQAAEEAGGVQQHDWGRGASGATRPLAGAHEEGCLLPGQLEYSIGMASAVRPPAMKARSPGKGGGSGLVSPVRALELRRAAIRQQLELDRSAEEAAVS